MCRHLGYVGPPRTLHALMFDGEHSLERQAYAPRMTRGNLLNADGFGIGWYPETVPEGAGRPVRFRRAQPLWTDASFREIARTVDTTCAVAAVRSATPGFPVDESCAQPFREGRHLFSHNGRIDDHDRVEAELRGLAGDVAGVPDARAPVDSARLFALAVRAWSDGADLGAGLVAALTAATSLTGGRFNLLASDGTALAATVWGDSLFVRETPDAVLVASEPLDGVDPPDPGPVGAAGWLPVPDRHLLVAAPGRGVTLTPIGGGTP